MTPVPDTVGEAIRRSADRLRQAGSPTPRLDAEVLLAHALGRDRAWLLAHPEAAAADDLHDLVERRAAGEPIAYIRGFKEWHGLRIRTDPRALIPRPETELLADLAADEMERRLAAGSRVVAWDVGTGSGAVAIAIALRHSAAMDEGRLAVTASDVSTDALALAADNLRDHGLADRVELVQADLLERAPPRPDVVVANLPYVSAAEVDQQQGSLAFEPRLALDGGTDGLDVVRRLMAQLPASAAPGASAFLEIGAGQASAVEAMAPEGASVRVLPDLAGLDRVVCIGLPTLDR